MQEVGGTLQLQGAQARVGAWSSSSAGCKVQGCSWWSKTTCCCQTKLPMRTLISTDPGCSMVQSAVLLLACCAESQDAGAAPHLAGHGTALHLAPHGCVGRR
jgi:hypothetical protein